MHLCFCLSLNLFVGINSKNLISNHDLSVDNQILVLINFESKKFREVVIGY